MILSLLLTIAGLTTSHNVTNFTYTYPGYWTYVEGGQTFVVKGQDYFFDGASGLRVSADYVRSDEVFKGGFE